MTDGLKCSSTYKAIVSKISSGSGFLRFDTIAEQFSRTASGKRCARSILRNLPLHIFRQNDLLHKKNNCLKSIFVKSVIFRTLDWKNSNVTTISNPDFYLFYQKE